MCLQVRQRDFLYMQVQVLNYNSQNILLHYIYSLSLTSNDTCFILLYYVKILGIYVLCRSFLYIEKDQDCVTLPANSKTDQILRRMSAVLYEKKGKIL